jgi:IS30 family transposase
LRKHRKKRLLGRKDRPGVIPNRVSIDKRPAIVGPKRYYGDWESDLIIGTKHEGMALTLVERKTKHCLIHSLEGKRSVEMMVAIITALQPFIGKIRSITLDNGKDFT